MNKTYNRGSTDSDIVNERRTGLALSRQEKGLEPPSRTQKRRRVLIACSNCRARKTKCDAKKPMCSTCIAASEVCDYMAEGIHTNTKILVEKELVTRIAV
jgi:hypothetical protein